MPWTWSKHRKLLTAFGMIMYICLRGTSMLHHVEAAVCDVKAALLAHALSKAATKAAACQTAATPTPLLRMLAAYCSSRNLTKCASFSVSSCLNLCSHSASLHTAAAGLSAGGGPCTACMAAGSSCLTIAGRLGSILAPYICSRSSRLLPSLFSAPGRTQQTRYHGVSAHPAEMAASNTAESVLQGAAQGVKKTYYKRKLPSPPAVAFSSPEGMHACQPLLVILLPSSACAAAATALCRSLLLTPPCHLFHCLLRSCVVSRGAARRHHGWLLQADRAVQHTR